MFLAKMDAMHYNRGRKNHIWSGGQHG